MSTILTSIAPLVLVVLAVGVDCVLPVAASNGACVIADSPEGGIVTVVYPMMFSPGDGAAAKAPAPAAPAAKPAAPPPAKAPAKQP